MKDEAYIQALKTRFVRIINAMPELGAVLDEKSRTFDLGEAVLDFSNMETLVEITTADSRFAGKKVVFELWNSEQYFMSFLLTTQNIEIDCQFDPENKGIEPPVYSLGQHLTDLFDILEDDMDFYNADYVFMADKEAE